MFRWFSPGFPIVFDLPKTPRRHGLSQGASLGKSKTKKPQANWIIKPKSVLEDGRDQVSQDTSGYPAISMAGENDDISTMIYYVR